MYKLTGSIGIGLALRTVSSFLVRSMFPMSAQTAVILWLLIASIIAIVVYINHDKWLSR